MIAEIIAEVMSTVFSKFACNYDHDKLMQQSLNYGLDMQILDDGKSSPLKRTNTHDCSPLRRSPFKPARPTLPSQASVQKKNPSFKFPKCRFRRKEKPCRVQGIFIGILHVKTNTLVLCNFLNVSEWELTVYCTVFFCCFFVFFFLGGGVYAE